MVNFCQAIKNSGLQHLWSVRSIDPLSCITGKKKPFVSLSLCNFHCFWSQEPISAKWRRDDGSVVTWGDPSCGGDASAVGSRSESRFSDVQLLSKWKHWEHILWVYLVLWFLTPQLCRKCFLLDLFAGSEENQGVSAAWKWMVNMFSASPSSRAVSAALPWQDTKACFSDLQHIWCFCSDQSSHLETTASDFADIFVVMPVLLSFVSSFKLKCILWGRICCDMGGCRLGRGRPLTAATRAMMDFWLVLYPWRALGQHSQQGRHGVSKRCERTGRCLANLLQFLCFFMSFQVFTSS